MSAPAPELHPIVWPDPSPLQHWWTHVMGRPRLHPDQSEHRYQPHPTLVTSSDARPARH